MDRLKTMTQNKDKMQMSKHTRETIAEILEHFCKIVCVRGMQISKKDLEVYHKEIGEFLIIMGKNYFSLSKKLRKHIEEQK